jgi:hypothetical protein
VDPVIGMLAMIRFPSYSGDVVQTRVLVSMRTSCGPRSRRSTVIGSRGRVADTAP